MDFTLKTYRQLLESLHSAGFTFITFEEYLESEKLIVKSEKLKEHPEKQNHSPEHRKPNTEQQTPNAKRQTKNASNFIILRHDVDLLPQNSLAFARIQHEMGIRGSYYFRAVPESWDEAIIKEIHNLGHEVGYHYEDVDLVGSSKWKVVSGKPGDNPNPFTIYSQSSTLTTKKLPLTTDNLPLDIIIDNAIISFRRNLEKLRQLVPVTTICMHGSPRSRFDNRDLWKKYDYRDFGIFGEPYFDMDFDDVFYLTDTGRRWDGWHVSVRDNVPQQQEEWIKQGLVFRSTQEIINRVQTQNPEPQTPNTKYYQPFPNKIMMTFHPQRWTDSPLPWTRELILQNAKNLVKGFMVRWQQGR